MAYITGTASDHLDLWSTLLDFLQNNADLVAASQQWTVAWSHPSDPELLLKGPGLSGTEEIFVGLARIDQQFQPDESQIYITGATGAVPTADRYSEHVNGLARRPQIFLAHNPMEYWMVANGRRFVVIVKVSTTYQAMYGGFYLPYATPGAYPYPLFIGGTRGFHQGSNQLVDSWRDVMTNGYRHFVYPWSRTSTVSSDVYDSTAFMLEPAGHWRAGTYSIGDATYLLGRFLLGPRAFPAYLGAYQARAAAGTGFNNNTESMHTGVRLGYAQLRARFLPGLDGEFSLTPITLLTANHTSTPEPVVYGILDGVYSVSGANVQAENLITLDGVDHLVVENVSRTDPDEYWALALE